MFAKPFIASLEGHIDAVEVLCRKPGTVNTIASGSWDGGEPFTNAISHGLTGHRRHRAQYRRAEAFASNTRCSQGKSIRPLLRRWRQAA